MSEQLKIIKQSPEVFTFDNTATTDDYHVVKGYATTYGNVDRVGDVIQKGAFTESLKTNNEPVILWQHDHTVPVGKGTLQDSDFGILLTVQMPKNDDFVKNRLMPQLQIGSVKSFSVGMFVDTSSIEYKKDQSIIKKASIFETSFVTFPANPLADILSVKSLTEKATSAAKSLPLADSDAAWSADDAVSRVRKFTKSEDAPSADYKRAFLWHDAQDADNFTAYKLPFADVIDGELKAVPRALSAAVAAINGARGGLNVPDDDLPAIKAVIKSYYNKLDKPDPFAQKQWIIDEVKNFTNKRDIENVLRESGLFSKQAAVYLASCFDLKQRDFADDRNSLLKAFERELEQLSKVKF